ncbi:unnamed protein product [Coregonus sp. 'balchen']|nr:unnamed protein product [Coregonus sp. 'balchen']
MPASYQQKGVVDMSALKYTLGLLAVLVVATWAEEELSVSELLEKANRNVATRELEVIQRGLQSFAGFSCINFVKRTNHRDYLHIQSQNGCWSYVGRSGNAQVVSLSRSGCVYHGTTQHELLHALGFNHEQTRSDRDNHIRVLLQNVQSATRELEVIQRGLQSFAGFSCINFVKRTNHRDYLHIQSQNGRSGCVYHGTTQHELLHALGFNHEQTRSDRDNHIRVLLQNVQSGMEHNFNKIATLNQGTAYDYNSVMQYHRYAFSKNNQPTMVPIPNQNVEIGNASQMSQSDITRLNRLYNCSVDDSVVDMSALKYTLGLLAVLVVATWAEEELSVSELLEKANRNVVHTRNEPLIVDDIAYVNEAERNADPCTSRGCMWPKSSDGKLEVIERGLQSFAGFSCINFVKRTNHRDYLHIQSQNGRSGCVYHGTTQHELLHALGFNHEQTRSDRDNHIRVLLQNVQSGMEHNFNKIATLNQGTAYDYNSVMQYHRYAFSKNNQPTMVPIPNQNVEIGNASQMSQSDITRLNRLYNC